MGLTEFEDVILKVNQIKEVSFAISELNWNKPHYGLINIISEFSERNSNLINTIIAQFSNNFDRNLIKGKEPFSDSGYIDNRISLFFVMRDIIENIEITFYLLLDDSKLINDDLSINGNFFNKLKKIRGDENMKSLSVSDDFKTKKSLLEEALLKKYKRNILPEEFKKIKEIKKECNNYIHKNGIKYINPKGNSYYTFMQEYLEKLIFVFKFNFKLLFLLEGHILSSSDYIDYLDMGMTPPKDSQYWIANIFAEYINKQFSKEEKEWLENSNNFGMKLFENNK